MTTTTLQKVGDQLNKQLSRNSLPVTHLVSKAVSEAVFCFSDQCLFKHFCSVDGEPTEGSALFARNLEREKVVNNSKVFSLIIMMKN